MENIELLIFLLLGSGISLLLLTALIKYFVCYYQDILNIKTEISRASCWREFVYWRSRLSVLRWSVLPGMNPERVKHIKRFFYRGKYAKAKEKSDGLTAMLLPSLLGVAVCAICLAGGTFAWFAASQTAPAQSIQTAHYSVTALVVLDGTQLEPQNGVYPLEAGKTYSVTLEATGNATTGYCIIDLSGTDIHTVQFPAEGSTEKTITFRLTMDQQADMKIIPQWGSSGRAAADRVADGGHYTHGSKTEEILPPPVQKPEADETQPPGTVPTQPPAITPADPSATQPPLQQYTVQTGDTLTMIAQRYGVSVEALQAHNQIADPDLIYVGQTIEIPTGG